MMHSHCFSFQSTLPARGATPASSFPVSKYLISIHAPREGSDSLTAGAFSSSIDFNPRSPRGERHGQIRVGTSSTNFNPRSPRGERRNNLLYCNFVRCYFNPRSPRGERPRTVPRGQIALGYFNPRSPRGERLQQQHQQQQPIQQFQSTLPARGATSSPPTHSHRRPISIHAPREGSDNANPIFNTRYANFNPRSPRGERQHRQRG